ncbi:hypothetical protein [uncultured Reyranella sp.]|uniref:hypothetical protein n=1 Tax=uncultured Reyranella sp. TaxID=735512 RepID=UPI00259C97F0|nr:hypothetical protein [uncultured Reyranella sp.]
MKSIYAGPAGNYQPGDLADFAGPEGRALVEGGFAEEVGRPDRERRSRAAPVQPRPAPETATPPAPETATAPAPDTATPPVPESATPPASE